MLRHLTLLLVACGFTFFVGLGRAAISDSDEAFYAEAAREMVLTGDWVTPRYNYEDRFQKPILYYWLAASVFLVTGATEVGARFPAACAGALLVIATWACGRRWYGSRVGLIAGCIAASNFGYFAIARLALPDLPLAAFMTLTTWLALEGGRWAGRAGAAGRAGRVREGSSPPASPAPPATPALWSPAYAFTVAASAAAALGFLTKGPVGVVLPLATVLVCCWLGLLGRRRLLPVGLGPLILGGLVFLMIAMPWFVAMERVHGLDYLYRFFVAENVERFATDRYNEPRSLFFYVPIVLGGLAPWSAFFLLWIPDLARAVRQRALKMPPHAVMLVIWMAVPLLFYSISIGKQPRYILPVLPPLAILVANAYVRRLDEHEAGNPQNGLISWVGIATGLLFVTLGSLLWRDMALLEALPPLTTRLAAVFMIAVGVVVGGVGWVRPRALGAAVTVGSIATLLGLWFSVFSSRGSDPVERMAAALLQARQYNESSGTFHVFVRNLVFYTDVPQTDLTDFEDLDIFLRQPQRVLVVIRQRDLERLRHERHLDPQVLASVRYFNPAAIRLKTLLWPNPEADLEEVHLIANR